jgi:hypothetical protein
MAARGRPKKLRVPQASPGLAKFNYDMTAYISQDEARAVADGEFPQSVADNLKQLIDDHVILSLCSFEAWYRDRPKAYGYINGGQHMHFGAEGLDWSVPLPLFNRFQDVANRIDRARVEPR